ncbi:MAG: SMP-30/gluconolactonase/LRE family protein [Cytophagales bacterium]|nr:SMP-30/gluconolactonase/LRE family protein [Armatimonadota bacterium]
MVAANRFRKNREKCLAVASWAAAVFGVCAVAENRVGVAALPASLPRERLTGAAKLEIVHEFQTQMPVGVAVTSAGRRFISYPRWEDPLRFTLAELRNGREIPYPTSGAIQNGAKSGPRANMVSLQGILVDAKDRLWALDTGTINMKPIAPFVPKLICIDTKTNRVSRIYPLPAAVVPPGGYLNDLRIDLRKGNKGIVYITDSGKQPGLVMVDLASGRAWRRMTGHPSVQPEPGFVGFVEGSALFKRPRPGVATHLNIGSDGITLSPDGSRLYYTPLAGRRLYSVATDALASPDGTEEQVRVTLKDHGDKGTADGLGTDRKGRIYVTNWEQNAVLRRLPSGLFETVVHDDRLLWPDTLDIGRDNYLYIISNQLHRQGGYNEGRDRREKPYLLTRIKIDAGPVLLDR